MNFQALIHLILLSSLILGLTGCQDGQKLSSLVIEERQSPLAENMTYKEWKEYRAQAINRIIANYKGQSSASSIEKEVPASQDIGSSQKSTTPKVKNKKPSDKKVTAIEKYSQPQIKGQKVSGKSYRVPPNALAKDRSSFIVIPDKKPMAVTSPKNAQKINQARMLAQKKNKFNFIWPVKGKVMVPYGKGKKGFNNGINIHTHTGTSVVAIEEGKVAFVGNVAGLGKIILIEHVNGWISAYAQISDITVKKGAKVSQGQTIAKVAGSPFNRSELHFEIRKGTKSYDPLKYLPKD